LSWCISLYLRDIAYLGDAAFKAEAPFHIIAVANPFAIPGPVCCAFTSDGVMRETRYGRSSRFGLGNGKIR